MPHQTVEDKIREVLSGAITVTNNVDSAVDFLAPEIAKPDNTLFWLDFIHYGVVHAIDAGDMATVLGRSNNKSSASVLQVSNELRLPYFYVLYAVLAGAALGVVCREPGEGIHFSVPMPVKLDLLIELVDHVEYPERVLSFLSHEIKGQSKYVVNTVQQALSCRRNGTLEREVVDILSGPGLHSGDSIAKELGVSVAEANAEIIHLVSSGEELERFPPYYDSAYGGQTVFCVRYAEDNGVETQPVHQGAVSDTTDDQWSPTPEDLEELSLKNRLASTVNDLEKRIAAAKHATTEIGDLPTDDAKRILAIAQQQSVGNDRKYDDPVLQELREMKDSIAAIRRTMERALPPKTYITTANDAWHKAHGYLDTPTESTVKPETEQPFGGSNE